MNTYIQNKLDELTEKYTSNIVLSLGLPYEMICYIERTITKNVKQSLTDYHNHIVDIIDGQTIIATDDTQFGLHTDGYNNAIEDILSLLKDTNPKE